jgi:tripartite-type tricarboxylate transporter receptor subunit TctC
MMRTIAPLLVAGFVVAAPAVAADSPPFPNRVIRVVAPEAGGSSDLASRIMTQALGSSLGQPAIVDNRGVVGVEVVMNAPADGHVLLHYTSPLWITPLLRRNTPWDALRDFAPITVTVNTPNLVTVHPSLPVKSVKELVALAKARPGDLNYGTSSVGTGNHLAGELFMAMTGTKMERIGHKGMGAAINSLLGGQIQVLFPSAGSVVQHIKQGRVRALAVTSLEPSLLAPGLPTVAQAGIPGYESQSRTVLFAPAKTPPAVIAKLHAEVVRALTQAETRERLFNVSLEVIAGTPQEAAAMIRSETVRMAKVIEDAGLRE